METIDKILAKSSVLKNLLGKTKELTYLNQLFSACVENNFAKHCRIVKFDIENKELHLVADSSAWAAKLRYTIPDILKTLKIQPEFKSVKKIYYSVAQRNGSDLDGSRPISSALPLSSAKKPEISAEAKKMWEKFYREFSKNDAGKI